MRIMVTINEHLEIHEIFNICDAKDGCLFGTIIPDGTPIIISDVCDPADIFYNMVTYGWADLSMFPACYLCNYRNDASIEADDMQREIEPLSPAELQEFIEIAELQKFEEIPELVESLEFEF